MSLTTLFIRIGIVFFILILIDFYVFSGIRTLTHTLENEKSRKIVHYIYWGISIAFCLLFFYSLFTFNSQTGPRGSAFKYMTALTVLLWLPKIVFCLFLLGEDIFRLMNAGSVFLFDKMGWEAKENANYFPERRKFVSQLALAVASIPFVSILYGVTKGKYNFKVHELTLKFKDLPISFDGFTLTQISDVHSGSFDSAEDVMRGIDIINAQKSDVVLFTGDLVNNRAEEFEPWIDIFKKIDAPFGKYSITGNHDYGEYIPWNSAAEKQKNFENLIENHGKAGFKILLNENIVFTRAQDQIAIVGVENWGIPPFPQYGDLNKAIDGLEIDMFKILMSHDPSHWDAQVLKHPSPFHLTLSGHTHGMQFGIEIPGFFKWSPVKFKYPRWADLYEVGIKKLYVNRGFGFIGFPGRVGIWPEITKITLKKG